LSIALKGSAVISSQHFSTVKVGLTDQIIGVPFADLISKRRKKRKAKTEAVP